MNLRNLRKVLSVIYVEIPSENSVSILFLFHENFVKIIWNSRIYKECPLEFAWESHLETSWKFCTFSTKIIKISHEPSIILKECPLEVNYKLQFSFWNFVRWFIEIPWNLIKYLWNFHRNSRRHFLGNFSNENIKDPFFCDYLFFFPIKKFHCV